MSQIGPYRIVGTLGHGAMGTVYRAVHCRTSRRVALKTVRAPSQAALPSLRHEIHALARIRHRGIGKILDSGVQDGVPWLATELIEGPNLREFVRALGPEPLQAVLHLGRRLCSAL